MKTKLLLITGSASYLIFLLILTPAANIVPWLNLPAQKISLYGISGSLWSGSIDTAVINKHKLQSSVWSLNPFSLFRASLSADLQTNYQSQPVSSRLDYSLLSNSILLTDLQSTVKADALQKLLNIPFGQLAGTIQIKLDNVEVLAGTAPLVNGSIVWNNAKFTLADTISFGQLQLALQTSESGDLSGKLSNTQGELSIQGDIKILADQSYSLNIKLKPRANASTELQNILSLIAPRKVKAAHIIQRNGHLRDLGYPGIKL